MKYDFDEIIDRRNTNSMNMDGFREYIFHADDTMQFPYKDDEFIRMWIADMEFATPDVIIEAVKERLDKRIFGYSKLHDPNYYKAFEEWCRSRYDWSFDRKALVLSNGIIPALYELVEYITKPDEKVMFLTPSYAYFKYAADYNNREYVCCDLINNDGYYSIDWEAFNEMAADEKTTLLIFCNPHNPSGRMWNSDELFKISETVKKNNMWIISDEIHCDLIRKGLKHIPTGKILTEYDRLITCMAPSKTFNMAGLMISNIIIPDERLRAKWNERHYSFDNPLSLSAAKAAYEKGSDWLEELKKYLDENFKFVSEYLKVNLKKAKFRISEATYLGWVDLSAYFDAGENLPRFFAYEAGVLLEGGDMFVRNSDCFIRLNLACQRTVLEEGLKRICEAVNKKQTIGR